MSNWLQTHSGGSFSYDNPTWDQIHIEDIAASLSKLCRFNGHTKKFYSVAEHSLLCSYAPKLSAYEQWCALLHDAHEAYACDVPTPMKNLLGEYKVLEKDIQGAVQQKYAFELLHIVHEVDMRVLQTERKHALNPQVCTKHRWPAYFDKYEPYEISGPISINFYNPDEAQHIFLKRFYGLEQSLLLRKELKVVHKAKGYRYEKV